MIDTEIETKINKINVDEIVKALKKNKAKFLENFFFRRYVFNLKDPEGADRFIRLRTDGKKTTLTYKRRLGSSLANTEEIEVEVSDFDATAKILSQIIPNPLYQESKRTSYLLEGVGKFIKDISIARYLCFSQLPLTPEGRGFLLGD